MLNAFTKGAEAGRDVSTMTLGASKLKAQEEQKKQPLQKRSGINRMSMAIYNVTDSKDSKTKAKNPKNVVSGLGYGTVALAKGVVFGITGLVTKPYYGAKEGGAKGAAAGVGKGLVGLVAKPVGGTIGLVGCTVQGAVSTPGTIAKAVTGGSKDKSKNGKKTNASA